MNFRELHYQESPLLICNIWNATSAKLAEKLNFKAVGTSSAAIANSFGLPDGENIPFSILSFLVESIIKSTKIPVSVDLEGGYNREANGIIENIKSLFNN